MEISKILQLSSVIPIVSIEDARIAVPLARALLAGGIHIVEIILNTKEAFDAVFAIRKTLPDMMVGVGMLLESEQFQKAKEAGAQFVTSPGVTPPLVHAAKGSSIPYLPGAVTPCEIMAAKQLGFNILKFFPAEVVGGVTALKMLASVFSEVYFCASGGITRANMQNYLGLKNVIAVAASWITPKNLLEQKDWDAVSTLAREVTQMRGFSSQELKSFEPIQAFS